MRLPSDLRPAAFIERLNRFCAAVEVEGQRVLAHVANSGRLRELLAPGMPVMVAPRSGEHRRTAYDLTLVRLPGTWVSADARLPPALMEEAVGQGRLEEFRGYGSLRREVRYGDSRLDIALHGVSATCLVEVKSVTLVRNGVGLFPDAPTERGRRHLRNLMSAVADGTRGAVVFVVQRPDVNGFSPNDEADPAFGDALREAASAGVDVYAYRCDVTEESIAIVQKIPVVLGA